MRLPDTIATSNLDIHVKNTSYAPVSVIIVIICSVRSSRSLSVNPKLSRALHRLAEIIKLPSYVYLRSFCLRTQTF